MKFRQRLWYFFEESEEFSAILFRFLIFSLIIVSSSIAIIQLINPSIIPDPFFVEHVERWILYIFTVEFIARLVACPKKKQFVTDRYTAIDFVAIAPFYLGISSLVVLRVLRIFRLFRLFNNSRFLQAFQLKNTILENITPVVLLFVLIKIAIWVLEYYGLWLTEELGVLFTIIGFALGIILSRKIGTTYGKYLDLEKTMFTMQARISITVQALNHHKKKLGNKIFSEWIRHFLKTYHGPDEHGMHEIQKANDDLYCAIRKVGDTKLVPHNRLIVFCKEIITDASFILGRKASYTPDAYDKLLQQITLMYLFLLVIFIPGMKGLISVLVATYVLYGMYYVTHDFDLAVGDDKAGLIKLEPKRLEHYCNELER
ncbi:MAG: ion transporter [Candidatus Woesearchaeota archaeon]|nr:ion transporter [Candidatus Woesearchaeota archaeon]